MLSDDLVRLAKLRIIVGYLGETDQHSWWSSSFLSSGSQRFLTPVFPKTWHLAQYHSITEVAARLHDDRIGTGQGVFHLFRLPEHIEKELSSAAIADLMAKEIGSLATSVDAALDELRALASSNLEPIIGPVRVDSPKPLTSVSTWQTVAGYYWLAFRSGNAVFPFFSEQ